MLAIWLISIAAALRLASSPWPMKLPATMPITMPISTSTTRISISVMPRARAADALAVFVIRVPSLSPVHAATDRRDGVAID